MIKTDVLTTLLTKAEVLYFQYHWKR